MKFNLRKAQAVTEMAIFGSIILLILGVFFSYIQKMNEEQYVAQESFRHALAKAYDVQASAGYTVLEERRSVSVSSPLIGDRSRYSGSAAVLWGTEEDAGGSWYKINEEEYEIDLDDGDDDPDNNPKIENIDTAVNTPSIGNQKTINYSPNKVDTQLSASVQESITYTFRDESGKELFSTTHGIGPDGSYSESNVGSTYSKDRRWVSSHSQDQDDQD